MNSYPAPPRNGLAVASLVLGILSLLCLGVLGGIPAVVCGHLARGRAQRSPQEYGGAGMALTGLLLGYLSIVTTVVIATTLAFYIGAMSQALSGGGAGKAPANPVAVVVQAKQQTEEIVCANNLKQIGIAFRIWSADNGDKFPFNVRTNQGGTLELCDRRPDGFEKYPAVHFRALSAELMFPAILRCPADRNIQPAASFQSLQATNVTYQLRSGPELDETAADEILCLCPVHSLVLRADASVMPGR